ncbi:unnamed protein product [Ilex paraguariensis]|uniref:PWWP domain-containing protein n=1 Tax=Ilex paraguariensis TaxID=185542 RepID=A0ABC8UGC5_9AQUA
MGSSDTGTGVADSSVGSIVWVRRRNGSWWPGKILGPDELSASHLMSPRSGTPVKLLGREDASVDWYNLEKSKRVKAFRCGEFDECIERAEASLGIPPKKREKYARREDAILHALELEKQLLEKKYGKVGHSSKARNSKSSDGAKKELSTSSECLGNSTGRQLNPKSHQRSKGQDLSVENSGKSGHQLNGDDDNSGALPRMRGLQDFGLRTASSKRKLSSSVASNGSQKPAFDESLHALSSSGRSTESSVHANSENLVDKRNRLYEELADESLVKRRDKRRPLVQVMQSSAKLSVLHPEADGCTVSIPVSEEEEPGAACLVNSSDCLEDKEINPNEMGMSPSKVEETNCANLAASNEEKTSGSTEDTETDSSDTDSEESDRDEDLNAFSG